MLELITRLQGSCKRSIQGILLVIHPFSEIKEGEEKKILEPTQWLYE